MKVTLGPAQYIRQKNALSNIAYLIKLYGENTLLIGGETALSITEPQIREFVKKEPIDILDSIHYGKESSWKNIQRLIEIVTIKQPDSIVAVGGGKAIDSAKAVAYATNKPLIAIPTIAATCAAATPISIIYEDDGTFIEISHLSKAPDAVLVDMDIIQNAPYRFLAAGIGDTLAKFYESRASVQKVKPNALNLSAVKLAKGLYELLLEKGKLAVDCIINGEDDNAIADVVDSIILVSGSVSGYGGDDCRTAAAHAIYSALTIFPEIHHTYHGEIVAYGILVQLAMENVQDSEIQSLINFYKQVHLPYLLNQMGIENLSVHQLHQLGEVAVSIEDMRNMPFTVTPEMVIQAIQKVESLGKLGAQQ